MEQPTLTEQLRALEERLLQPDLRASRSELDRLLAPGFVEFASDGKAYDREQVIAALQHETPFRRSIYDFRMAQLSDDVALTTYQIARENNASGEIVRSMRSSVWKHNRDGWQLVFHQGTIRLVP